MITKQILSSYLSLSKSKQSKRFEAQVQLIPLEIELVRKSNWTCFGRGSKS